MRLKSPKPADAEAEAERTSDSETLSGSHDGDHDEEEEIEEKMVVSKVVVVGDHGVGKTSIVKRLLDVPYQPIRSTASLLPLPQEADRANGVTDKLTGLLPATTPTVGTDFFSRVVRDVRARSHVRLQFWDTAGLDRYASAPDETFRGASAIIAVFDVGSKESFVHVTSQHLKRAMQHNPGIGDRQIFVVGNKVDLIRCAEKEDADAFVAQSELQSKLFSAFPNVNYYEVSTQTNYGLREVLQGLCHGPLDQYVVNGKKDLKCDGKPAPHEGEPLLSILPPVACDSVTTVDGETETDGTLFTAEGTVASGPLPASLGSKVTAEGVQATETGWFTPREFVSDVGTRDLDEKTGAEERQLLTCSLCDATVTIVAGDVEVADSQTHVDPGSLSFSRGDERDMTLYSVCSAPDSTVADDSGAGVDNNSRSCVVLDTQNETSAGSLHPQHSATPPSVEHTARYPGSAQQLYHSISNDSCVGSASYRCAAAGRNATNSSIDEHVDMTSHRRRIDDMLERIDRDAELESSAQVRCDSGAAESGADRAPHKSEKQSKINFSSCLCFGSKSGSSKRSTHGVR